MSRGATLVDVPGLHAKVYIGPDVMVVGSANASMNGLAEEGCELRSTIEAGFMSSDPAALKSARAWFDDIFARGREVTQKDLAEIAVIYEDRRRSRPPRGQNFLRTLASNPRTLSDRRIFVAVYDEPSDAEMAEWEPAY